MDYMKTKDDAARAATEIATAATDALSSICRVLGPDMSDVKVTVEVEKGEIFKEHVKCVARREKDKVTEHDK